MSNILVVYSSHDGQTARVAERIAGGLRESGNSVTVRSVESPEPMRDLVEFDAALVGGAVRFGHYAKELQQLVRERAVSLEARPSGFFSVCLSAANKPAEARRCIAEFLERTGWHPDETASFAGALPYSRYNPFIRFLMRLIVGAAGGDTDTSRDYEYTDWPAVDRFAAQFAARVRAGVPA